MLLDGSYGHLNDNDEGKAFAHGQLDSQPGNETTIFSFRLKGASISAPRKGGWKSNLAGIERLKKAGRIIRIGNTPRYVRYFDDAPYFPMGSGWLDTGISGFGTEKIYVVQTHPRVVERCILMTTDPGDLVLDPTCGSGTAAYAAEQWGRRWITVDTSRVRLHWRGHASWVRDIPGICSRTARGAAEGGGDHGTPAFRSPYRQRHRPGFRLRAACPTSP